MNANNQSRYKVGATISCFFWGTHLRSLTPSPPRGEGRGEGASRSHRPSATALGGRSYATPALTRNLYKKPSPPGRGVLRRRTGWVLRLVQCVLFLVLTLPTVKADAPDQIYLRDGQILEGLVLAEQRGAYLVQAHRNQSAQVQIPKDAVKFVYYADPARAEQFLDLRRWQERADDATLTAITFLTAEPFGQAILEAATEATESIWIMAYYLSGSRSSPIKDFYEILREKAREGVDVVILCEFGSGTRPSVRRITLNFAQELAQDGVTVRFIQEGRTMHKKMIIVDGHTVLLGSSNLTLVGTTSSTEINVKIKSRTAVRRAIEDYARMRERALPADELRY